MRDLEGLISVICEFEGSTPLWYMADGHISKEAFQVECATEFKRDFALEDIKHAYARNVPAGRGMKQTLLYLTDGPGYGAFPVTYVDLAGPLGKTGHVTVTCPDCGASIPADGACWYCENDPAENSELDHGST